MADLAKMLNDDDIQEVKSSKSTSVKNTRGVIPALLLKARTDAHLTHLRQKDKTLALHNAMSMFYEGVVDLVDTYIETSMGIDDSFTLEEVDESEVIANPLAYFKNLYNAISVAREAVKESFLQSQIDLMQELVAHTLYRIKNIVT
jgi:Family of unknown function (DUF5856)